MTSKGPVPIIGHGKREEKELPKADKALSYINNLAKNVEGEFKRLNTRLDAVEKLTTYMMATKRTEFEDVDELDMMANIEDYQPAIGLVYYYQVDNKFVSIVPYIDNFEINKREDGTFYAEATKYAKTYEVGTEEKETFENLRKQVFEYLDKIHKEYEEKRAAENKAEAEKLNFDSSKRE